LHFYPKCLKENNNLESDAVKSGRRPQFRKNLLRADSDRNV
jgi:hypothetical protein